MIRQNLIVFTVALAHSATASTFDATTGKVVLDRADMTWSADGLQDLPVELPLYIASFDGNWRTPAELRSSFLPASQAIEGDGALRLGGPNTTLLFDLRSLRTRFAGRRIEITFWQRPLGTWLVGSLGWAAGDLDAYWEQGQYDAILSIANVDLQRTGRATDDGWEEWTTGPIDFELAGQAPPGWLLFNDASLILLLGNNVSAGVDPGARVAFDALALHDLGPAIATGARCSGASEGEVCGDGALCLFGRCTDAAQREGAAFQNPEHRRDFLQRLVHAFDLFDGSRETQRRLPRFRFQAATLTHEENPKRFWRALRQGVEAFHDGHAFAPGQLRTYLFWPTGACLLQGEADLLPGGRRQPLVIDVQPDTPLGQRLQVGDALVAIDGRPVRAWAEEVASEIFYPGDPAGREVVEAGQLLAVAWSMGSRLRFERCPALAADGACAAPLEVVRVDLARLASRSLWAPKLPTWLQGYTPCDNRVERTPELGDRIGFNSADFTEVNGVRYIAFNGFPITESWGGSGQIERVFSGALGDAPPRVIIDTRLGYGGYADQTAYTSTFLLGTDEPIEIGYPNLDLPLDPTLRQSFETCGLTGDFFGCGFVTWWSPSMTPSPHSGVARNTRTAILVTDDASGNDVFPRRLQARGARTRVFGPAPTWGAFGWILALPTISHEVAGGSLQVTDNVYLDQNNADPLAFRTGQGVTPDTIVFQKQSDLLAGVDTLMETARAWVQQ